MKLLAFVVLATVYINVGRSHKKAKYYRDHHNDNKISIEKDTNITIGIDLDGKLRKLFFLLSAESKPDSNTLCSPLSALLPLAKMALGAEGDTLDELLAAVGVTKKSKIGEFFKPLLSRLRCLPGVKLDIVSKLFVSKGSHIHRGFRNDAREVFHSSVAKVDFTYPSYAIDQINTWIASQTNGIIKDLLEPKDISSSTSMILVNAVYFNGRWTEPFEKVSNLTFHSPSSNRNIEMMTREGKFNYTKSEALGSQIISIPYFGGGASLVVLCPLAKGGLEALLSALRLTSDVLSAVLGSLRPTHVRLTLPKFKMYHDLDLGKTYSKIGIETIFDKKLSGLKKIVQDQTVYVTKAKHKCFIDVNEYGTEAVGSSANTMTQAKSPMFHKDPIEFLVDHPFLYFILVQDQQLFSGTFVNPDIHI